MYEVAKDLICVGRNIQCSMFCYLPNSTDGVIPLSLIIERCALNIQLACDKDTKQHSVQLLRRDLPTINLCAFLSVFCFYFFRVNSIFFQIPAECRLESMGYIHFLGAGVFDGLQ